MLNPRLLSPFFVMCLSTVILYGAIPHLVHDAIGPWTAGFFSGQAFFLRFFSLMVYTYNKEIFHPRGRPMKHAGESLRIIALLVVVTLSAAGFTNLHAQVKAANKTAVMPQFLPDLVVSDLTLSPDCFIVFTLKNTGTAGVPDDAYSRSRSGTFTPCTVRLRFKGTSRTFPLAQVDPSKRLHRGRSSVVFRTPLRLTANSSVLVIADPGGTVRELNEKNNRCLAALTPRCSKVTAQHIQQGVPGAAATQVHAPQIEYTDFTVIHAAHKIEANGKGCWETLLMNPTSEGYSIHSEIHELINNTWQLAGPDTATQLRRNGSTRAKHLWNRDPRSTRVKLTYKRHNGPVKAVVEKPLPAMAVAVSALTVSERADYLYTWRIELANNNPFTQHNIILVPTILVNNTWDSAGTELLITTLPPGPGSFTNPWSIKNATRCRIDVYTEKNPGSPRLHLAHRESTVAEALSSGTGLPPNCFHVSRPIIEPHGCGLRWKVTIANYSSQYVSDLRVYGKQRVAGEWKPLGSNVLDPMPPSNVVPMSMAFYPKPGADVIKVYVTSQSEPLGASELAPLSPIHYSGTISVVQFVPSATTITWSARIHNTSDTGICNVRIRTYWLGTNDLYNLADTSPVIDSIAKDAYKDVSGQISPSDALGYLITVNYMLPDGISPEQELTRWTRKISYGH